MNYSKIPLIDVLDERGITPPATYTLAAHSNTVITKTYNDGEQSSETLQVLTKCYLQGDTSGSFTSFRYRTDIYGVLNITFYANPDDDDATATEQSIVFFPSNLYEKSKALPLKYMIPIHNQFIQTLTLTLYNDTATPLVFEKCTVKRQVSEAEQYAEYTGITRTTLTSLTVYTDGCKLFYSDQQDPTVLQFQGDANNNLTGIIVNPGTTSQKIIQFTRGSGPLPS